MFYTQFVMKNIFTFVNVNYSWCTWLYYIHVSHRNHKGWFSTLQYCRTFIIYMIKHKHSSCTIIHQVKTKNPLRITDHKTHGNWFKTMSENYIFVNYACCVRWNKWGWLILFSKVKTDLVLYINVCHTWTQTRCVYLLHVFIIFIILFWRILT